MKLFVASEECQCEKEHPKQRQRFQHDKQNSFIECKAPPLGPERLQDTKCFPKSRCCWFSAGVKRKGVIEKYSLAEIETKPFNKHKQSSYDASRARCDFRILSSSSNKYSSEDDAKYQMLDSNNTVVALGTSYENVPSKDCRTVLSVNQTIFRNAFEMPSSKELMYNSGNFKKTSQQNFRFHSSHHYFLPILETPQASCERDAEFNLETRILPKQQRIESVVVNSGITRVKCTKRPQILRKLTLFTILLCLICSGAGSAQRFDRSQFEMTSKHYKLDTVKVNQMPEYLVHPLMIMSRPEQYRSPWLFPSVVNLASQALISANATCGLNGEVKYCKLVEHVDRRASRRNRHCSLCNAFSSITSEHHSIQYAIDGRGDRWWQSPTIEQGYNYHWVTITLNLRQVFQVAYVIVKAANSPRPGNWILEKSLDGVNWQPWQYFAISDSECYRKYGLPAAGPGAPKYASDTEVMCTSYFSQLIPLENGEIHVSLINGRPSAENPSPQLVDFTSAQHIRLRMQKIRTLHGDLMTLNRGPAEYADPFVTRRYFYSIKDISIGGMCICYGHAATCPADTETGLFSCECNHNTAGPNCEACAQGYSQLEWQPGNNGFQCEACNCHGHAEDCYYDHDVAERGNSLNIHGDYIGGGVCVGCRDNTDGINCETCIDGYYRPLELDADSRSPCVRCVCNPFGGARVPEDTGPFVCVKDATFVDVDKNLFPGYCYCKEGYTGPRCDRCIRGYHGFPSCKPCLCNLAGSLNSDLCTGQCVCKKNVAGKSCSECRPGHYNLQSSNPHGCEACYCSGITGNCQSSNLKWSPVQTNQGWEVRDRRGRRGSPAQMDPDLGEPYVEHGQAAREVGTTMYYWSAPKEYLGKRLSSYGGNLRYVVSYDIFQGQVALPIQDADVVLESGDKAIIYNYRGLLVEPQEEEEVSVPLTANENSFGWVDAVTRYPITKPEMMMILKRITRLLIRAVYSRNHGAVYRIRDVYFDVATPTGVGKVASSVEVCECPQGYAGLSCESCKVGYWRSGMNCLPCQCNGHSRICNQLNGVCENCHDNTMGTHCERCKPGYYGDATWGTSSDCQRCSCPLPVTSNNFSPTCQLDRSNGNMICLECPVGYIGRICELCANGYFGEPAKLGGNCQPCQCNGNSKTCDPVTGKCTSCQGHTAGDHCERCEAAYYGDALIRKNCGPCECHPFGSNGRQCDAVSGQCLCKRGVYGRKCNACAMDNYLSTVAGMCVSCDCDRTGSLTLQCTSEGICLCKTGVKGQFCDTCANGFYSFSSSGCTACDCAATNGNCDAATGQCVCPTNTEGFGCSQCVAGSYQWEQHAGCKICGCNPIGTSPSSVCNNETGQCLCKSQYGSQQCDQCRDGYFGFPNCRPCECNSHGTKPERCTDKLTCSCSDKGKCFCKENVAGDMCDRCAPGTFGLASTNPRGCTKCYCSDVTNQCTQAPYVWGPPISLDFQVDGSTNIIDTRSLIEEVLFSNNVVTANADAVKMVFRGGPYYWRLPTQFNGNKALSYGGKLSYTIEYTSAVSSGPGIDSEAGVIVRGGDDFVQTIQYHTEDPVAGHKQTNAAPMTEFGWTDVDTGANVTRAEFSNVLRNIQFFLIKASYGYLMGQSRLSNVFLDLAIPGLRGRGDAGSTFDLAIGVEQCSCPAGYTGLSCEKCSTGYMRIQQGGGPAKCEQCSCRNRSNTCVMETGQCLNCKEKFTGKHCETCIAGYYLSGDICRKCACPGNVVGNNFSPTCYADDTNGYTCDACQAGYTGKYCERCADGYYGDPAAPGGFCAKCGCNVAGSVDALCNKTSGQCHCDVGIQGRICDQCLPGHVITPTGCMKCHGKCIETLLIEVEKLMNKTGVVDIHHMFPPPWNHLLATRNVTAQLQNNVTSSSKKVSDAFALIMELKSGNISDLENRLNSMISQASRCVGSSDELSSMVKASEFTLKEKKKIARDVSNSAESYSRGIKRLLVQLHNGSSADIASMYFDANLMTNRLHTRDLSFYLQIALNDISLSEALVSNVIQNFTKKSTKVENHFRQEGKSLLGSYDAFFSKLNNTQRRLLDVSTTLTTTNEMNNLNRQYHRQNEGDISRVGNIATMTDVVLEKGSKILYKAKKLYNDGRRYMDMLYDEDLIRSNLRNVTRRIKWLLENKLNPAPRDLMMKVKKVVEDYKKYLQNNAAYMRRVYSNVSIESFNQTEAASRWTNIAGRVEQASKSSFAAHRIAIDARKMATNKLKVKADASLSHSKLTYKGVMAVRITTQGDRDQLNALNNQLRSVNRSAKELHKKYDKILSRMQRTESDLLSFKSPLNPTDVRHAVQSMGPLVGDVESGISRFQQKYQQLDVANLNTQKHNTTLKNAGITLAKIPKKLSDAAAASNRARHTVKRLELIRDTVAQNISHIRKLIEDTRRKAASIRSASVKSTGSCTMQYKPTPTSGKITEIVLNVQTNTSNNMLFYLAREKKDYIAVELREHKVFVTWNLGGGPGFVQNPLRVESVGELDWYTIEVMRKNQHLNVTVYQLSNKTETMRTSHGSSPGDYAMLNVNSDDTLFVGGITQTIDIPKPIIYRTFTGCMGEAFLQGKSIGLWNFKNIQHSEDCKGCVASPPTNTEEFPSNVYSYNGHSYSLLKLPLHRQTENTKFLFKFQTFSSEGLLLYMGSKEMPDFLSLELLDGRLVLKMDMGDGVHMASSAKRYNRGKWVFVAVGRRGSYARLGVKRNGILQEQVWLNITTVNDSRLDLKTNDILCVGGFPTERMLKPNVTRISFIGCIRELSFSGRSLVLKSNRGYGVVIDSGVAFSCPAKVTRDVGISKNGHVELPPVNLPAFGSISMTFNTRERDAILLLATSKVKQRNRNKRQNDLNYYSIYLSGGRVHAKIYLNNDNALNISSRYDYYSNGETYLVTLRREESSISLHMNENDDNTSGVLAHHTNQPVIVRRLFVGGVPAAFDINEVAGVKSSLNGCLKDLIINNVIDFKEAIHTKNIYMGTCEYVQINSDLFFASAAPPPSDITGVPKPSKATTASISPMKDGGRIFVSPTPRPNDPSCKSSGRFSYRKSSAHFGISQNSHLKFTLKTKISKRFTFELRLKTSGNSGLLLYSSHASQRDFFSLKLKDGKPVFQFDNGQGVAEAFGRRRINDGKWHKIRIKRTKRQGLLLVDKQKRIKFKAKKGATDLDIDGKLFVGGLPKGHDTTRVGQISNSMDVCIKSLKLNKRIKLEPSKANYSYKVQQCYKKSEPGAYFDGSGFAVFNNKFRVGPKMMIEMEFRTWRAHGVLISVDSKRRDGLALEMVNGTIYFRTDNGAGAFETSYKSPISKRRHKITHQLCDGKWHSIQAEKNMNILRLAVDGQTVSEVISEASTISADTKDPLFIGGIPSNDLSPRQIETTQSFEGCIRNLKLKSIPVPFDEIYRLGVFSNSCPISKKKSKRKT